MTIAEAEIRFCIQTCEAVLTVNMQNISLRGVAE